MSRFSHAEFERLRRLRQVLLDIEGRPEGEEAPRYWETAEDIRLYDAVFAARIGWKWDAVLRELELRERLPAPRVVLDWGAGTGAATRALLARIAPPERVVLFDRDPGVLAFARESLAAEFPGVEFESATEPPAGAGVDLALASHVLDELSDHGVLALHATLREAAQVIWVEPGTRLTSRRLGASREALLDVFDVAAPCTHRAACGVLAEGQERHWCHLFARPPGVVHTDGDWRIVGRELGIDLRSLPYAFLALTRKPVERAGETRVLGRGNLQRGRALVDLCSEDGYTREAQLLARHHKPLLKELKKPSGDPVVLDRDGHWRPFDR